jgi:hypothetical protein
MIIRGKATVSTRDEMRITTASGEVYVIPLEQTPEQAAVFRGKQVTATVIVEVRVDREGE